MILIFYVINQYKVNTSHGGLFNPINEILDNVMRGIRR